MTNIDTQIIFDKNGNPIPQYLDVSDKTGGSAGTMKPITGQNGAQFTQLTGSIVEREVYGREVRNETTAPVAILSPVGAKKMLVYLNIYNSTGTFGSGEGAGIYLSVRSKENQPFGLARTDKANGANRGIVMQWSPENKQKNNDNNVVLPRLFHVNLEVSPRHLFQIEIDGTFEAGEGIDCDMQVHWYF